MPRARPAAYVTPSSRPPVCDSQMLATWIAFWSLIKTDPVMAALHTESYARYRGRVGALLAECGVAETAELAIGLTALNDGLWLELTLDPATFGAERARAIMADWVDRVLP